MKFSFPALVIGSLIAAVPAFAQPATEALTLQSSIERAIAGNLELKREQIAIQIVDARLMTFKGAFDVVLSAGANYQRQLTSEGVGSGFGSTRGFDFGLARRLETGGLVRLGFASDARNTSSRVQCGEVGGLPRTCTFYDSNLSLEFNHPLLEGFGTHIALANVRKQRILKDIALLNRQTRAANILRDVIITYWELAYASQDLAIRSSAVELAREQLRITKAQIDVGRLAPVDSAAVERAIGERLQEVALSEERVFLRTLELRTLLGLPPAASQPVFTASDVPSATSRSIDIAVEVDHALESNPQLRAVKTGLAISAIDLQTARNTLLPRLDLVTAVGATGRRNDFAETLRQVSEANDLTWSAGLRFELPIPNRTARGQAEEARLDAEDTRLDAAAFELSLRQLVLRLTSNINTSSKRVALAKQTVGFAQLNLEAEKARFSVGRSTNNDVLLRQQELKNAEIQVVRATVDLLNSEAHLAAATGELLERYGVTLKGL